MSWRKGQKMSKEQRLATAIKRLVHKLDHLEDIDWIENTSSVTVDPDWDQGDLSCEHTLLSGQPTFQPRR